LARFGATLTMFLTIFSEPVALRKHVYAIA